jgi:hypothetical protein
MAKRKIKRVLFQGLRERPGIGAKCPATVASGESSEALGKTLMAKGGYEDET